jgi:gliding motility-associated-like protein
MIKDANNCTDYDVVTLTSPSAMSAEITSDPEICGAPGGASVTVTGGVGPYTYLWNTNDTTSSIHGVYHGTYTVTVTDANLCTTQFTAIVDYLGGNAQLSYTFNNVLCYGESTGQIELTVQNITPPYTVNWSHTSDTSLVQQNLPAGAYNVTVSDMYGCTSVATISIAQPPQLSLTYTSVIHCANDNNGQITLNVSGGVSPYTYSWSNGGSSGTISPIPAGVYYVTVTDANNCTISASATELTNPPQLIASTQSINPLCFNGNEGMIIGSATGGTPPYQYTWTGGIQNDTLMHVSNGTYVVTVSDAHNCTSTSSSTLYNPPAMNITGQIQQANHMGSIDVSVSGGTAPYNFVWSNGATTEDVTNLGGGTYILTVTDGNNCMQTDTFVIDIPLEIPTVITPNGDGKNDDFEIVGIQAYQNVSIEIYGRWGDLLFDFKGTGLEYVNKTNRWNGKYNGKDLPMGSYVYIIKLNDDDPLTGVVAIIR